MQCYADTSLARLAACTKAASSPVEAIRTFNKMAVGDYRQSLLSGMCMLVKTISELTEDNAELLAEAQRLLGTIEDAFTALLVQAQQEGALDASKDST